ncbi:hypothetical protein CXG81DRAFT_24693 [Caulochytrium protostelioides]|uniref:Uncharacterized protein n=1 Tax=Caulochytrium protostelioides TaxID=1555241 RepID=A0A4P9XBX0_9FUNG|nr:hypothetical protein CXG81DRAFT_24693 [Caulochytrium protostelioides]|eukprot:RKP02640.1 hypothetical protein CXG81DRAFT_24693 [Caulochytrium protostelioides]
MPGSPQRKPVPFGRRRPPASVASSTAGSAAGSSTVSRAIAVGASFSRAPPATAPSGPRPSSGASVASSVSGSSYAPSSSAAAPSTATAASRAGSRSSRASVPSSLASSSQPAAVPVRLSRAPSDAGRSDAGRSDPGQRWRPASAVGRASGPPEGESAGVPSLRWQYERQRRAGRSFGADHEDDDGAAPFVLPSTPFVREYQQSLDFQQYDQTDWQDVTAPPVYGWEPPDVEARRATNPHLRKRTETHGAGAGVSYDAIALSRSVRDRDAFLVELDRPADPPVMVKRPPSEADAMDDAMDEALDHDKRLMQVEVHEDAVQFDHHLVPPLGNDATEHLIHSMHYTVQQQDWSQFLHRGVFSGVRAHGDEVPFLARQEPRPDNVFPVAGGVGTHWAASQPGWRSLTPVATPWQPMAAPYHRAYQSAQMYSWFAGTHVADDVSSTVVQPLLQESLAYETALAAAAGPGRDLLDLVPAEDAGSAPLLVYAAGRTLADVVIRPIERASLARAAASPPRLGPGWVLPFTTPLQRIRTRMAYGLSPAVLAVASLTFTGLTLHTIHLDSATAPHEADPDVVTLGGQLLCPHGLRDYTFDAWSDDLAVLRRRDICRWTPGQPVGTTRALPQWLTGTRDRLDEVGYDTGSVHTAYAPHTAVATMAGGVAQLDWRSPAAPTALFRLTDHQLMPHSLALPPYDVLLATRWQLHGLDRRMPGRAVWTVALEENAGTGGFSLPVTQWSLPQDRPDHDADVHADADDYDGDAFPMRSGFAHLWSTWTADNTMIPLPKHGRAGVAQVLQPHYTQPYKDVRGRCISGAQPRVQATAPVPVALPPWEAYNYREHVRTHPPQLGARVLLTGRASQPSAHVFSLLGDGQVVTQAFDMTDAVPSIDASKVWTSSDSAPRDDVVDGDDADDADDVDDTDDTDEAIDEAEQATRGFLAQPSRLANHSAEPLHALRQLLRDLIHEPFEAVAPAVPLAAIPWPARRKQRTPSLWDLATDADWPIAYTPDGVPVVPRPVPRILDDPRRWHAIASALFDEPMPETPPFLEFRGIPDDTPARYLARLFPDADAALRDGAAAALMLAQVGSLEPRVDYTTARAHAVMPRLHRHMRRLWDAEEAVYRDSGYEWSIASYFKLHDYHHYALRTPQLNLSHRDTLTNNEPRRKTFKRRRTAPGTGFRFAHHLPPTAAAAAARARAGLAADASASQPASMALPFGFSQPASAYSQPALASSQPMSSQPASRAIAIGTASAPGRTPSAATATPLTAPPMRPTALSQPPAALRREASQTSVGIGIGVPLMMSQSQRSLGFGASQLSQSQSTQPSKSKSKSKSKKGFGRR